MLQGWKHSMSRRNLFQINRFSTSSIFVHLSHFSIFYICHFYMLFLHQVIGSTVGGVVGEAVMDAEKESAADQLVHHLSHCFVHLSHFFVFYLNHFL
jgi:hypothetical protein